MAPVFSRQIIYLGVILSMMALAPVFVLAESENDWGLAHLDSLWAAGHRDSAMTLLFASMDTVQKEADTPTRITFFTRAGYWHKIKGEAAEGEPYLRKALRMAEASGDSSLACAPIRKLGTILNAMGRNDEAYTLYVRLETMAADVGDVEHEGWANVGLGYGDGLKYDNIASLKHYQRAMQLFKQCGDEEAELWATLGTANARFHLAEFDAAGTAFAEVAEVARKAGFSRHEAIVLNNSAGLRFALGRPDLSLKYYERAVALWDSIGQDLERLPPSLNMGSCLALLGREDEARMLFENELALCRKKNYQNFEARALRKLAKLDMVTGNNAQAEARYNEVLQLGDEIPMIEKIESSLGLAALVAQRGDHDEAMRILLACESNMTEDTTSQSRAHLDLALTRTFLEQDQPEMALKYLDHAHSIIGQANSRDGMELEKLRAEYFFVTGHRDSARIHLEAAADFWEQERGTPLDPDWREERGSAGRTIYCSLAVELAATESVATAFERMQTFKARVLRERRFGPGRMGEEAIATPAPAITLSDFQQTTLHENEVFLDTYVGQNKSLIFSVTQHECRLLEFPGEDVLKVKLTHIHELASTSASKPEELQAAIRELSELLLGDLDDLLASCSHLILAPDGIFNLTPTSMLFPPDKDIDFSRVPSAAILTDLRQNHLSGKILKRVTTLAVGEALSEDSPQLPGANMEIDDLDNFYKGVTLIKPNATGSLPGLELLSSFDMIHVAAHSVGDDRNAWQSAIMLHPTNQDLMIRASDLIGLKLDTSLVVLASCSSATGRIVSGEGVQGLTSAFLATGVPSVVAALWPVDDDATGFFMAAFYESLSAGNNAAAALSQARNKCQNDSIFNLPFHWGAFVLVGDNQMMIPLEKKPDNKAVSILVMIYSLVILVIAITVFFIRKKRSK